MKTLLIALAVVASTAGANAAPLPSEMLGAWCVNARVAFRLSDAVIYSRDKGGCEASEKIEVRRDGFELAEGSCRFSRRTFERLSQVRVGYAFVARCSYGDADRPRSERGAIGLRYDGDLVIEWR